MRVTCVKVDGQRSTAVIKGRTAHLVSGNVFGAPTPTDETAPLSRVEFLVPMQPATVLAIGIDDMSHADDRVSPSIPRAFIEGPDTPIAHGAPIVLRTDAANVQAEVVAMIGKRAKDLTEDEGVGVLSTPAVRAK